jgi:hypothetical protein
MKYCKQPMEWKEADYSNRQAQEEKITKIYFGFDIIIQQRAFPFG